MDHNLIRPEIALPTPVVVHEETPRPTVANTSWSTGSHSRGPAGGRRWSGVAAAIPCGSSALRRPAATADRRSRTTRHDDRVSPRVDRGSHQPGAGPIVDLPFRKPRDSSGHVARHSEMLLVHLVHVAHRAQPPRSQVRGVTATDTRTRANVAVGSRKPRRTNPVPPRQASLRAICWTRRSPMTICRATCRPPHLGTCRTFQTRSVNNHGTSRNPHRTDGAYGSTRGR